MSEPSSLSGVVLVGGRSVRFGRDKLREPFAGGMLVERAIDALRAALGGPVTLVGACDPEVAAQGDRALADAYLGHGPAGGLLTVLEQLETDIFLLAGDLPAIVAEGAREDVDAAAVARRVAESAIPARPIAPREEVDPTTLPEDVAGLLGADAQRVQRAWAGLGSLSRFVVVHVARKSAQRGEPLRLATALAAIVPAVEARSAGRVREQPLSADEAVAAVSHPGAGGVSLFLGVVRDTNEERAVTLLEYQAYRSMAEAELERIEREIEAAIPGARVFATHRVGALHVGDVAVVCAASAPHRREAFSACRQLIDEIKARLPIWKREHGPEGPHWVGWEDARCVPSEGGHRGHGHG